MRITTDCKICGDAIESSVPAHWHPSKLARRALRDMQAHMKTHSFLEVLRFEIRQDLDQVPEEDRASIVRDIYRHMLGTVTDDGGYQLGAADSQGLYSIDEALGHLPLYQLWRRANQCGAPGCQQH